MPGRKRKLVDQVRGEWQVPIRTALPGPRVRQVDAAYRTSLIEPGGNRQNIAEIDDRVLAD